MTACLVSCAVRPFGRDQVGGLVGDQRQNQGLKQGDRPRLVAAQLEAEVCTPAGAGQPESADRHADYNDEHQQAFLDPIQALVPSRETGDVGERQGEGDGCNGGEGLGGHGGSLVGGILGGWYRIGLQAPDSDKGAMLRPSGRGRTGPTMGGRSHVGLQPGRGAP